MKCQWCDTILFSYEEILCRDCQEYEQETAQQARQWEENKDAGEGTEYGLCPCQLCTGSVHQ